tara:strand:+ start:6732 stop:7112 length:381 start_codon:yes stop_codon:yes gene_type:complete
MKPRFEDASPEVYEMLNKAIELEEKLETLEKAKMCSCGSGKPQAVCCPDMKKANYATTFSTEPGGVEFHSETGGQTRNAHYTTNQHLLDSTDVTNKGATNESVSLDSLSPKMNTHDRASEGRVDEG